MKSALEGGLTVQETLPYVDRCLACLGCVTACPSGVAYGELISAYRAHAEPLRSRPAMASVRRILVQQTLPYPGRFRVAATLGRAARPLYGLTPKSLRPMLGLLPEKLPATQPLPADLPCHRHASCPGGAAGRLRPAGARSRHQLGDAAGAGGQRRRDRDPGGAGVLRRARHAPRRDGARPGVRPAQYGGLPAGRGCDHHQRGRLRFGRPRVHAALRRRAGPRVRRGVRTRGEGHHRLSGRAGDRDTAAAAAAAQGGLSRRLPPGPRAGGDPAAADFAAQHPEPDAVGDPGGRAVLRLGGHLQHGAAGDRRAAGPAQGGEHPAHRRGRGRGGQHRLSGAGRHASEGRRPPAARSITRCRSSTWRTPRRS